MTKGASETIKNGAEVHLKRKGFIGMLSGTLGAKLLGNLLPDKDVIWAGKGATRAGQNFYCYIILWQILKYKDIF